MSPPNPPALAECVAGLREREDGGEGHPLRAPVIAGPVDETFPRTDSAMAART